MQNTEMTTSNPYEALSQILQWACSPRGGNNFWGRILNGCGRRKIEGLGTAAVTITREGKYMFLWDPDFFTSLSVANRIVIVVHEAAHLVLSHIERTIEIRQQLDITEKYQWQQFQPIMNIAMDMAANDIAIRGMIDLKNFQDLKDALIFPEKTPYCFPRDKSYEEYLGLLLEKCKSDGYNPRKQETDSKGNAVYEEYGVSIPKDNKGDEKDQDANGEGGDEKDQDANGKGVDSAGDKNDPQSGKGHGKGQINQAPDWLDKVRQNLLPRHIDIEDLLDQMTESEVERVKERLKREAKKIVKTAAKQTVKSRGVIPGSLQEVIDDLLKEPTLPWYEVLRNALRSSISSKLAESTAWPNLGILATGVDEGLEPFPGMQKDFEFFITVAIDTSGSVSDDDFITFMSEIQGLMKTDKAVTTRVIYYDAAIQKEFIITPDDEVNYHCTRHGYGGTDFCPAFRRVSQLDTENDWEPDAERITQSIAKSDLFIHFTDGYAPVHQDQGGPMPELTPPCPLIWVLTEDGREDPNMGGIVLQINLEE